MKLSIIIPAYNVEQYLERCIDSCENQNIPHEDYEIIIVNDGSPDNTLQMAYELAEKHGNLVVLTQENGGSSKARNHGLSKAKGDYVWFVDADDYIVENCIARVLGLCNEYNLDICHFALDLKTEDGNQLPKKNYAYAEKILRGRDLLLSDPGSVVCSVCANFYKRSFLIDNGICFVEGITQQDGELNGRAFAIAERCYFVNDSMYVYFYNPESIRRSPKIEKRMKYAGDTVRVLALRKDFYETRINDKELKEYFSKYANSCIAGTIRDMVRNNTDKRILDEFIRVAREKSLYPISGKTISKKWMLLKPIMNTPSLWWILKYI